MKFNYFIKNFLISAVIIFIAAIFFMTKD